MIAKSTQILFDDIERFITESRALLKAGEMLEMQGLDEQVRTLCQTVLQLSQEERVAAADRMQHVLAELKALGESMTETRDNLAEEIRGLSTQKKAATAYKIADSRDDFGKRKEEE